MAKWLLEQPGVDINGRNDVGRTVIMTMIFEATEGETADDKDACPLSDQLLEEVCEMIEQRNADPNLVDNQVSFLYFFCLNDFQNFSI